MRSAVLLLVATMLMASPAVPVGAGEVSRRRAEVRAETGRVRARVDTVRSARAGRAAAVARADRRIDRVARAVAEARRSVRHQRRQVAGARRRLAGARRRAQRRREEMGGRLARLYMSGGTLPTGWMLTAAGPRQAARRSVYAAAISRADARVLRGALRARDAVTARWRELAARRGRLRTALRARREALVVAARRRRRRRRALASSTRRLGRLRARETRLENQTRRLVALGGAAPRLVGVGADRSTRPAAGSTAVDDGWTWPASGPLTSGFGMRWGSLHGGIDIGAPEGAPVVAASEGVVRSAGYESGYGNTVVVDHGGSVITAYAHLSSIATTGGTHVRAGDHIGSVGSTGNVTGPHLHFEVRVDGSPVEPMGYLP